MMSQIRDSHSSWHHCVHNANSVCFLFGQLLDCADADCVHADGVRADCVQA